MKHILLAALVALACGCLRVHQIDRENLSSRVMQFEPMGARQGFLNDLHSIREGASGGVGQSAGGGCGCN